jgi:putative endonuclease
MGTAGDARTADRRTSRRVAGDLAEDAVARHLAARGWTILARNLHVGRSELDIVAREPSGPWAFVIVEVRSRTVPRFGAPEESVDAAKVARLYAAAWDLARARQVPDGSRLVVGPFRVDLVTVVRESAAAQWRVSAHLRGLAPP